MARRLTKSERIIAGIWSAVRNMIEPELVRFRSRYPDSRRRTILEAMYAAAESEGEAALVRSGGGLFSADRHRATGLLRRVSDEAAQSLPLGGEGHRPAARGGVDDLPL